jgi:cephalosporin hydroxylase/GT2 family glycosyltransferase
MYPLWDDLIAPLVAAVSARRVIEIGALRGETTVKMLHDLGEACELHVIDPLPQFDPGEHERAFPGRYFFHRAISHDVLPTLPPADVVLVDGDHNWFTVYNELEMLAATAAAADRPLPLIILHDVGFPYGRRDLYYEPDRIPAEFRQPYQHKGVRPGRSAPAPLGGMNIGLANADHEGGPRNGVLTAVDDFVAKHERPLRLVVVPVYFGLAVIADEALIAQHPALAALLERIASTEGQSSLVALGERIRIDEVITFQTWFRALNERNIRSARRGLAVVKAALLDEHYLENELRIDYLQRAIGQPEPNLEPLRDPPRLLAPAYRWLVRDRATGHSNATRDHVGPYAAMGRAELDRMETALDLVREDAVAGDFAEIGVGRGGGAIFMRTYVDMHELRDRRVWVVDEFDTTRADLHQVRDGFSRFGVLDDSVRFVQGSPAATLPDAGLGSLAFVRFGDGLGAALAPALAAVAPHLAPGAVVIVSGTSDPAVETTVRESRAQLGIDAPLERIDWNAVVWRMPDPPAADRSEADEPATGAETLRLVPTPPAGSVALSVVVVFHNMRREARRTLQSLSRSYQRGVEDLSYEVIAIDNGSNADERLTPEDVRSYGPEFHLLDMGALAHPSPTGALNAGVALARGENIALMIDGAHVLTPGVLHHAMLALTAYEPAVVAVQQWYVGPGQQPEMSRAAYDQGVEDKLFDRIEWPGDGYRLFEIGHFIGERDWFDGLVESNCVVAPRKLLEQVGVFDERFSMPGAGYANLDLFERIALAPGVTVASVLGEGTFHQFHGGTTTNVVDPVEHRDRVMSYDRHFTELRNRPLLRLDRAIKYVGALEPNAAKRTRARRAFRSLGPLRDPVLHGADAPSVPVPDELRLAAIDAVWDQQAWKETRWLGHRVNRYPADLHAYQELLARERPDVVVVTGDDDGLGGRAIFAASICDLLDHGRVIAVGTGNVDARAQHARVTLVPGRAEDRTVAANVLARVQPGETTLIFLASGAHDRVVDAFEAYAPLVAPDGYVVVENTVVNGRPAAAGFGAGPLEAVFRILGSHPDFISDHDLERYTVTFNREGFLRRLASP